MENARRAFKTACCGAAQGLTTPRRGLCFVTSKIPLQQSVLQDITAVWEKKYQAIQCMQGQEHLWEYYTRVALQRGVQAKRNIGITAARDIVHGEAFQSIFPRVTENLA